MSDTPSCHWAKLDSKKNTSDEVPVNLRKIPQEKTFPTPLFWSLHVVDLDRRKKQMLKQTTMRHVRLLPFRTAP
jgi:hypothetical protein